MALPSAVQRQLDQAEALQQSLQAPADVSNAAPEPQQPPAEPAAPAPAPVDYEHRFKTLQGMYNAEVPTLRAQNKVQEAKLVQLTEQVTALTQAMQAAAKSTPDKAPVDQRDVEAFGAELVEMVNKYAQQAYSAIQKEFGDFAARLDQRVKDLESNVNGVRQETAESREELFYRTLQTAVPDWQVINQDERWLAWLAELDPIYHVPRQAALDRARATFNAEHAAKVFEAFKQTLPVKPSQQQLVTPRTNAAPQLPNPAPAVQPITQKYIQDFYLDQAKGRYRGRDEEFARKEAEINLAISQGRVV